MDYLQADPQFVPLFMDVVEMKQDYEAVRDLLPMLHMVDQLQSLLSDTAMLAGSESYVAALTYYHSVKMAMKHNVPGAKSIYEDLRKRFNRTGKCEIKDVKDGPADTG